MIYMMMYMINIGKLAERDGSPFKGHESIVTFNSPVLSFGKRTRPKETRRLRRMLLCKSIVSSEFDLWAVSFHAYHCSKVLHLMPTDLCGNVVIVSVQ